MSESVIMPIAIAELEEEAAQPSLTYRLDLDKGRIIGMTDGLEAINQAIRKHLITSRFKCLIYDNQYGSEITEMIIAGDVTPEYIHSEIPRLVKDALSIDERIIEVYDFEIHLENDKAEISFKADTIYGETTFREVI